MLLSTALFILVTSNLLAQPAIEWDKTFGSTVKESFGSVKQTVDGGFISVGNAYGDVWIVKMGADGTKQWDLFLGGSNAESNGSIELTPDGGYIVGSTSTSGIGPIKSQPPYGTDPEEMYDYWVVKLSASGVVEWEKTIGGPGREFLRSVTPTIEGGYIVGGISRSEIGNDKTKAPFGSGVYDHWIVKLSSSGDVQWETVLRNNRPNFKPDNRGTIIELTSDGGYIVGGFEGSEQESFGDYYIAKLSQDGTVQWENSIGGDDYDELRSVQQTTDGGYLLGGWSFSGIGLDKSEGDYNLGQSSFWIVKVNANGTKLWDKVYSGENGPSELNSVAETSDGGFLLGGYSYADAGGDKSEPSRGSSDFWVIKIDSVGTKIWDKTIGGTEQDILYSIRITSDGGIILGGDSYSPKGFEKSEESRGNSDYWIVKLAADGPPLPVTLTSFNARKENQTAFLNWQTASETRSDRFEVQHSINGKAWNALGTVEAKGESNALQSYQYVHTNPTAGENLYRLKMVDTDGTFTYSNIENLDFDFKVLVNVFPNPASETLTIESSDWKNMKRIQLLNSNSIEVYSSGSQVNRNIDVKRLPSGLYFVKLTRQDGTSVIQKVIVAR